MTNIIKKLSNYAVAFTKHAAGGFKHVTEEVYEKRRAICESCPLLVDGECGLCGCPVEVKALWATEACPDKKWLAEEQKKEGFSANSVEKPVVKKSCNRCKNRH
jgi:hypothetical protein